MSGEGEGSGQREVWHESFIGPFTGLLQAGCDPRSRNPIKNWEKVRG
jgi:hypothetical protein